MLKIKKKNIRSWQLLLCGALLLLIVDRFYVFRISDYSANEQGNYSNVHNDNGNRPQSPFLAFIADVEEFIDAHEKLFIVLATIAIAWFTATLWRATADLFFLAKSQAKDMKTSLGIADKSAKAMEDVAAATKNNAVLVQRIMQKQMRAYLSVKVGSGTTQETPKNLKFAVMPSLINTGHTPAKKISYWAKADILPFPLPQDFIVPIGEDTLKSAMMLGPQQDFILNAVVENFVSDEDTLVVAEGITRRVYIWGVVTYEDVFEEAHFTEFFQSIYFFVGDDGKLKVAGSYCAQHTNTT